MHLEALEAERPKPQEMTAESLPVQHQGAAAAATVRPPCKPAPPPPEPSGPPPPPPPPPIALKFIGTMELTEQHEKIAILSDGKGGVPIYGTEGETSRDAIRS